MTLSISCLSNVCACDGDACILGVRGSNFHVNKGTLARRHNTRQIRLGIFARLCYRFELCRHEFNVLRGDLTKKSERKHGFVH
jgi:hypothetical protein